MLNRKRDPAVKTVRPAARITMRLSTTSWYRGYDLRYQTLKKATEQHKWSDITNRGCFNCYALSTVCVIMISRGLTFRIADEIVGRIC